MRTTLLAAFCLVLLAGCVEIERTIRLNNEGQFALPSTRVEAMYAPEMFGEWPNARLQVGPAPR